jgi:hypothetical protein
MCQREHDENVHRDLSGIIVIKIALAYLEIFQQEKGNAGAAARLPK